MENLFKLKQAVVIVVSMILLFFLLIMSILFSVKKLFKLKQVVLIVASMTILFSSCSKQLNILPTDQVDGSVALSNLSNINLAVLGIYANWKEEYVNRIGSVLADECRIGLKNKGIGIIDPAQNLFRWTYTSSDQEVADVWTNAYQLVYQVNQILSAIDQISVTSNTDLAQRKNLKGELLAIRAFLHFELYRVYGYSGVYNGATLAVPYVTGTDIYEKPARPTTYAFFRSLKVDLNGAETLLTADKVVNRLGATALQALDARVALYAGDWAGAIQASTRAINNVPLATKTDFANIWTDQSTAEVIFALSRTNQNPVRPGDMWYNIPNGIYLFAPSKTLMNLFDSLNDVRYKSYFSVDSTLGAKGQLPDVIAKYQGTTGAQNLNNLKVFRTGEMYLIRAEAYANMNKIADANKDLNTLRAMRINGYSAFQYNNAYDLLAAVASERYKELCYEGHRYFDIKRKGQDIIRQTADLPSGGGNAVLTPASIYYYIPIPQTEVLANSNILPNNAGW